MNIFFREIRAHYKGLIGWTIGMAFLVISSMAKLGTLSSSGQNAAEILKAFPKPFLVIFGISGFDLQTAVGYFGVTFLYIALMATIHAAMMGANVIAKEERDHTAEFLYPKPVSRNKVVTAKLMAGLFNVLVLFAVTVGVSLWSVDYYAKTTEHSQIILTLLLGLLMMQLIFFALGAFFAGVFKNPKLPIVMSTSVLLTTYVIWVVIDLNSNFENLKYLTPFKYFDAATIINSGHLDSLYVAISAVLVVVMTLATYIFYNRRDLRI